MAPIELVIALGNRFRRDDGVGLVAGEALRAQQWVPVRCLEKQGDGLRLLDAWRGARGVILIDAVASGAPPGTLHRFEIDSQRGALAADAVGTTHSLSVRETIELASALGEAPERILAFGIEMGCCELGEGLTAAVERAVPTLIRAVLDELESQAKPERKECTKPMS